MCIGAGAGVSEPGLNRWPDNDLHLRYGGGLKILWRRPSWVQVPPPAPLANFSIVVVGETPAFFNNNLSSKFGLFSFFSGR